MRLLFFLLMVSIFNKVAVQAVCVDNPDGYDDYNCQHYAYYCTRSGLWYDEFRSACRKTCIICQEKGFKLLNWPKMASAYCPGGYGRFTTIHQAITACLEDQNCAAISDQGCNNRGFSLCRQNHQPK